MKPAKNQHSAKIRHAMPTLPRLGALLGIKFVCGMEVMEFSYSVIRKNNRGLQDACDPTMAADLCKLESLESSHLVVDCLWPIPKSMRPMDQVQQRVH